MEKNRFQLENGLELRVEPSFRFEHIGIPHPDPKFQGSKVERVLEDFKFQSIKSYDISLYKGEKLCLSPKEDYYNLQDNEDKIDRSFDEDEIKNIFVPLALRLVGNIPLSLARFYEIFDAGSFSIDLEKFLRENDYIRFLRKSTNLDLLFIRSSKSVESFLIDTFWCHKPKQIIPDKYLGTALSLFFVKPDKFDRVDRFERVAGNHYTNCSDNSVVYNSKYSIQSLSYGYRLRAINFKPDLIYKEAKKILL